MDKMSTFDSLDPIPTLGEGKVVGTSKRVATPVEVKHRWEAPLPKGVTVGPNGKWVFDPAKGEKPPEPKSVVKAKVKAKAPAQELEGFHIGDWVMVNKERFPQDLVGMDGLMRVTGFSQKDWLEVSMPSGAKGFELMPCFAKKVEVRFARQGSAKGHGHFVVLESRGYGPHASHTCLCEDGAFFSSIIGQLDNFSVVVPAEKVEQEWTTVTVAPLKPGFYEVKWSAEGEYAGYISFWDGRRFYFADTSDRGAQRFYEQCTYRELLDWSFKFWRSRVPA